MIANYDMSALELVVMDNTPRELAKALKEVLFDACDCYMNVARRGCPSSEDSERVYIIRQLLDAIEETHPIE